MPKVTFIQGLVASGKSHLASELEALGAFKIDDSGFNPTGEWAVHFNTNYPAVISKLQEDINCVIVEVYYNQQANRETITQRLNSDVPDVQIEWIFFDNDLETALWNCFTRYYKGEKNDLVGAIAQNFRMHQFYEIPDEVDKRPIFKTTI